MFKKNRNGGDDGQARANQAFANVTMESCTEFECRFLLVHKSQGGRPTPVFDQYRPAFRFDDSLVTGTVTLPAGTEMVMPGGDWTEATVRLAQPAFMTAGLHFSVHEGDRTVGTGQVTKIIK